MAFAERFGATVEVEAATADVGWFMIRRRPGVDHARFRATVAAAVGGREQIQFDGADGFVIVVTRHAIAHALQTHPMVDHVGGVVVDPERLPAPELVVHDETDAES